MFRTCLFPALLFVSSIHTFHTMTWAHGYHEQYQRSLGDVKKANEIGAEASHKIKENTASLRRIRRDTDQTKEDTSSSFEEITYNPNISNPFDDPNHFVHKYHFKRNRQEEKTELEWMNATREIIDEEIRNESYVKSDYKFRAALEEKLFELGKKGQFVELERLVAQIERAQKLQDEFQKSLEDAGKKANRTLVTPLPDNPVPGHHQHLDHLRDIKSYMIRRRAQGASERLIISRVSDKMMEYWFNFVGNQTAGVIPTTSRPTTPEPMEYVKSTPPPPVRNPFHFFNAKHNIG
uniref:Uncharacterized protein n=1 Tax=Cacopsylla melanoneura TaxID=428564 RepID=A0A8D8Q664_9HEMI